MALSAWQNRPRNVARSPSQGPARRWNAAHPLPFTFRGLKRIGAWGKLAPMMVSSGTDSLIVDLPDFDLSDSGPDFTHEAQLIAKGLTPVAGVDEAGRGPIAGPVVAAAVILDPDAIPAGLNDSKKLTAKRRAELFDAITASAHVAWAGVSHREIDRINIRQASLLAMTRAVKALEIEAGHVLVDGRDVPPALASRGSALIKGDARALSIAAASIVAKVMRDRMMARLHERYEMYRFDRHAGYGTAAHLAALRQFGPSPVHRRSFAPVRQMLEKEKA